MTKVISMLIFTAILIFFVWQILLAVDKQAQMNHGRDCKEALQAEQWTYINNFCKGE